MLGAHEFLKAIAKAFDEQGIKGKLRELVVGILIVEDLIGILMLALLTTLIIGTAISMVPITEFAAHKLGLSLAVARVLVVVGAIALAAPFAVGVFRISRGLGVALALAALPAAAKGTTDLAAAPRRALVVTLQFAIVLLVGLPLLAVTQPFLQGWTAAAGLSLLLVVLGIAFWRSALNLQGHVKAGAQMIVEALVTHAGKPDPARHEDALASIQYLMPGLGVPVPLRLDESSAAIGRTLAQLNLRGLTGASVIAIARGEQGVIAPTASEELQAGDVLALAGTHDAVAAAIELLQTSRMTEGVVLDRQV